MIKIGIPQGDINGVGYELILRALENPEILDMCTPVIYGSPKVATYHRKNINSQTSFVVRNTPQELEDGCVNMINCFGETDLKIEIGQPTEDAGKAALIALGKSIEDIANKNIDAMVTAPLNNNTIKNNERIFPGQPQFVEQKIGNGQKALAMMVYENLRIAFVTVNNALNQVPTHITKELLAEKLETLAKTLKRDFNINNPRIAVLAINPNYGNDGIVYKEEEELLIPTIKEEFEKGVPCFGPYAADRIFGTSEYKKFDAILAMYYDQGAAPFRSITYNDGVLYTAGLPVVLAAPINGTDYELAGKDMADESSMRHAIYTVIDVVRNRRRYDESYAHPLKRQYYEKRDDSDKLKLDQPTEEDNA